MLTNAFHTDWSLDKINREWERDWDKDRVCVSPQRNVFWVNIFEGLMGIRTGQNTVLMVTFSFPLFRNWRLRNYWVHVRLYTCCAETRIRLALLSDRQCDYPLSMPDELLPIQSCVTVNFRHKWFCSALSINYYTQNKVYSHNESLLAKSLRKHESFCWKSQEDKTVNSLNLLSH